MKKDITFVLALLGMFVSGGEMRLITRDDDHFPSLPPYYLWRCFNCHCESTLEATKKEALAWAEQPIPFLPEKQYTQDDYIPELVWELNHNLGHNLLIDEITAALAVKTTEQ